MAKRIFIATHIMGKIQPTIVTEFAGVADLRRYAEDCGCIVPTMATIDQVCTLLDDKGPGHGARRHYRISYSSYSKKGK